MLINGIKAHKKHLLLFLVFVLASLNRTHPVLRFSHRYLDLSFFFGIQFIPLVLLLWGLKFKSTLAKAANSVMCGLLTLAAAPTALFLAFYLLHLPMAEMRDSSWELRGELPLASSVIREYRLNGGATTSYTTVLRQEMPLIPGIKLVRDLYSQYRIYDVETKLLDDAHVEVAVTESSLDTQPKPFRIHVKRHVYLH